MSTNDTKISVDLDQLASPVAGYVRFKGEVRPVKTINGKAYRRLREAASQKGAGGIPDVLPLYDTAADLIGVPLEELLEYPADVANAILALASEQVDIVEKFAEQAAKNSAGPATTTEPALMAGGSGDTPQG